MTPPKIYPPLVAPRRLLFGAGPSTVAPRVQCALAQPVVGPLDPFFFEMIDQIRPLMGYAYSTSNACNLVVPGTGSSGMEACVASVAEPGQKFAVLSNGYFAERLEEMARRQGADVVKLAREWGEPFDYQQAREFIRRERPRVVAFVQAETSSGMLNQAKPICEAAREVDAVTIADCVTSLGAMPVMVDENGIDLAYSCTQKGLSCPPGLSPVTAGPRALERIAARASSVRTWYLDLQLLDGYFSGRRYHHTASATLYYALREGLALVAEEGIEIRWERHRRNHLALVAGFEALGLEMLVGEGHRLSTVHTPRIPPGIDDTRVRRYLLEHHQIEIAGTLGPLNGKVFRIGLMGEGSTGENVRMLLERFEEALRDQGYRPA